MLKILVLSRGKFFIILVPDDFFMQENEKNPLENDSIKAALNLQPTKPTTPLRLTEEEKEAFGLRIATFLRAAWLAEIHQSPSDLERVFQMAMENFKLSLGDTGLPGQHCDEIMIRLIKQLYHHFKMNFKETTLETQYTAYGSFQEPSENASFEIEEVFEDASEGFIRDLS